LGLIDPLLAGEDFLTASRVLAAARPVAARDPDMAPAVQDRSRAIETLRATHDRAIVAFDKLKTAPNEPSANFAAGSYLCFYKGQWEQGLPMLAKGSDPNIKQLAALEMLRPTAADEMLRIADGWRDTAAKQPEAIRPELLRHALSQYKMAREVATGLQRALLERRIADVSMAQSASIQAGKAPGPEIIVNSIGMKFVRVKAGSFVMGSPVGEAGRQDDETQHKVQLTQSFYMQTTPVTQVQWNAIMESNPSHNQGDALPVDSVTWDESVEFCKRLGQKDGKHYRLPTEAEWEYACRAGGRGVLSDVANLNDFAWYSSTSEGQTHPVARKKPNELGLYDMLGNVAQLCSDGYGPYHGDAVDPTGADNASSRVLRGGSWSYPRPNCRAAFRNKSGPGSRHDNVGFRVCLDY
jgi:formylglycine-generating enzyme required for sulfatase activity